MKTAMKRILRWVIGVCVVLALLILIGVLSLNTIAKSVAQKRIRAETGMETHIGQFKISFASSSVTLLNFKLINPAEFGGSTFLDIPELHLEVDREALNNNRLHLRVARFNLGEIHVVETKEGKKNTDSLQKSSSKSGSTNKTDTGFQFAGIDKLDVTIAKTKFTSFKHPEQNFDRNLGIQNRVFTDLKTEKDLQNAALILTAQAGFNVLLQDVLSDPEEALKRGTNVGKETKKILEEISIPLKKP